MLEALPNESESRRESFDTVTHNPVFAEYRDATGGNERRRTRVNTNGRQRNRLTFDAVRSRRWSFR
jgi:hypothetical protein